MSKECVYDVCWQGRCKKPATGDTDFCEEHLGKECKVRTASATDYCNKQAIGDCHEFAGSFVCGTPLCEEHKKTHVHFYNH